MVENKKDIPQKTEGLTQLKKPNALHKPAAAPKQTAVQSGGSGKADSLVEELENKLDDLFAEPDDGEMPEKKHQTIGPILFDREEKEHLQETAVTEKKKDIETKSEIKSPARQVAKKTESVQPPADEKQLPPTIRIEKEPASKAADTQKKVVAAQKPAEQKPLSSPKKTIIKARPSKPEIAKKKADPIKPIPEAAPPEPVMKTDKAEKEPAPKAAGTQIKKTDAIANDHQISEKEWTDVGRKGAGDEPLRKNDALPEPVVKIDFKKEPGKPPVAESGKRKSSRFKLLGVAMLLVGAVAVLIISKPLEWFSSDQRPEAPTAYKIKNQPSRIQSQRVRIPAKKPVAAAPVTVQQSAVLPVPKTPVEKKTVPMIEREINLSEKINDFLMKWKTAWENTAGNSGAIEAYMSFYAEEFNYGDFDKNGWRTDKAAKNSRKKWIRVQLDKINLLDSLEKDRYEVSFRQNYKSSNYSEVTVKTLILKKDGDSFKIVGIKAPTTSYPYSIHEGSYRSVQTANEHVETVRKMGLAAYWSPADLGSRGVWYRVFIGYFTDPGAAQKIIAAKRLKDVRPEKISYANLIGSYFSREMLKDKRRSLSENGYSPYVIMDENDNLHLYVGAFYTLKNAETFAAELNDKGIPSRVVKR